MLINADIEFERSDIKTVKKKTSSINSNAIDVSIYTDVLKDNKKITDDIINNISSFNLFDKLSEDMFNSLYKYNAKVFSKDNVLDTLSLENDVIRRLCNHQDFNGLRKNTVGDIINSTIALRALQRESVNIIKKLEEEYKEEMEKMDKAIGKQQDIQNKINQLESDRDEYNEEEIDEMIKNLQDSIDKIDKNFAENKNDNQNSNSNSDNKNGNNARDKNKTPGLNGFGLSKEIDSAISSVKEHMDEVSSFFPGSIRIGGDASADVKMNGSYKDKEYLSNKLMESGKLKSLAKSLGRMNESFDFKVKKPSKYGVCISDVGVGNKVNNILSSEKILLSECEDLFFKKFVEKQLLEFKKSGTDFNSGPLVICVDISGSMSGNSFLWAASFTVTMLKLAIRTNRSCKIITFNSDVGEIYEFVNKNYDIEKVIQFCSTLPKGGTDYISPLNEALSTFNSSKYKKADLVFITDGEPNRKVSNDESFCNYYKRVKKEKEFKTQGIYIGNYSYFRPENLEFCDSVTPIKDFLDFNAMQNIINNVNDKVN